MQPSQGVSRIGAAPMLNGATGLRPLRPGMDSVPSGPAAAAAGPSGLRSLAGQGPVPMQYQGQGRPLHGQQQGLQQPPQHLSQGGRSAAAPAGHRLPAGPQNTAGLQAEHAELQAKWVFSFLFPLSMVGWCRTAPHGWRMRLLKAMSWLCISIPAHGMTFLQSRSNLMLRHRELQGPSMPERRHQHYPMAVELMYPETAGVPHHNYPQ